MGRIRPQGYRQSQVLLGEGTFLGEMDPQTGTLSKFGFDYRRDLNRQNICVGQLTKDGFANTCLVCYPLCCFTFSYNFFLKNN